MYLEKLTNNLKNEMKKIFEKNTIFFQAMKYIMTGMLSDSMKNIMKC